MGNTETIRIPVTRDGGGLNGWFIHPDVYGVTSEQTATENSTAGRTVSRSSGQTATNYQQATSSSSIRTIRGGTSSCARRPVALRTVNTCPKTTTTTTSTCPKTTTTTTSTCPKVATTTTTTAKTETTPAATTVTRQNPRTGNSSRPTANTQRKSNTESTVDSTDSNASTTETAMVKGRQGRPTYTRVARKSN